MNITRALSHFQQTYNKYLHESESFLTSCGSSAPKEMPSILYNLLFHHRVHKSSLLVLILRNINPVHTLLPYFFKIRFNTIVSFSSRSSKWAPSRRFPHLHSARVYLLPHTCYTHRQLQPTSYDQPNNIWRGRSVYYATFSNILSFLPLRYTYLSQHSVLAHPQRVLFL